MRPTVEFVSGACQVGGSATWVCQLWQTPENLLSTDPVSDSCVSFHPTANWRASSPPKDFGAVAAGLQACRKDAQAQKPGPTQECRLQTGPRREPARPDEVSLKRPLRTGIRALR